MQEHLSASHQAGVYRRSESAFLPKRLLSVGSNEDPHIKLVDTNNGTTLLDARSYRYAALSYCWGTPEKAQHQVQLTSQNIRTYTEGINTGQLSAVMQDAILVCRVLDIPFLWIDALCILQDSLSDWEEQSQEMNEVFGNSWLTICATSSSSCQEGFLQKRRPPALSLEYISRFNPDVRGELSFRSTPAECHDGVRPFATLPYLAQDLDVAKWSKRGWIFQEKILSPRKLYFGHSMIHFQRDNLTISENGFRRTANFHSGADISSNAWTIWPLLKKKRHLYAFWLEIVKPLTDLLWTDERDLFPAMSGITAAFSKAINDRYLAGHWLGDLACSLLWYTLALRNTINEVLENLSEHNTQSAPSWSWASRHDYQACVMSASDDMCCRIRSHIRQEFEVVETKVSLDGRNSFGRLKQASLLLSGSIIPFPEIPDPGWTEEGGSFLYNTNRGYWIAVMPDWNPEVVYHSAEPITIEPLDGMAQTELFLVSSCCSGRRGGSSRKSSETGQQVLDEIFKPEYWKTFFHDSRRWSSASQSCPYCQNQGRIRDVWGLLLYPAAGGQGKRYYRVGIFLCRAEHGGSDLFRDAERREIELI